MGFEEWGLSGGGKLYGNRMGSSGHGQGRRWYNDWAGAVLISSGLIEPWSLKGKSYLFYICILGGRIMRNLGGEWGRGIDHGNNWRY